MGVECPQRFVVDALEPWRKSGVQAAPMLLHARASSASPSRSSRNARQAGTGRPARQAHRMPGRMTESPACAARPVDGAEPIDSGRTCARIAQAAAGDGDGLRIEGDGAGDRGQHAPASTCRCRRRRGADRAGRALPGQVPFGSDVHHLGCVRGSHAACGRCEVEAGRRSLAQGTAHHRQGERSSGGMSDVQGRVGHPRERASLPAVGAEPVLLQPSVRHPRGRCRRCRTAPRRCRAGSAEHRASGRERTDRRVDALQDRIELRTAERIRTTACRRGRRRMQTLQLIAGAVREWCSLRPTARRRSVGFLRQTNCGLRRRRGPRRTQARHSVPVAGILEAVLASLLHGASTNVSIADEALTSDRPCLAENRSDTAGVATGDQLVENASCSHVRRSTAQALARGQDEARVHAAAAITGARRSEQAVLDARGGPSPGSNEHECCPGANTSSRWPGREARSTVRSTPDRASARPSGCRRASDFGQRAAVFAKPAAAAASRTDSTPQPARRPPPRRAASR